MVLYNLYLLKKYYAHINIKVDSFIKVIIYLYQYICKGHDIANVSIV